MNKFAYLTTGYTLKGLYDAFKTKFKVHGEDNIPEGSIIFVINHFTRIETMFLPCHIYFLTDKVPVWSLADHSLFQGGFGNFLESVGAVSTRDPDRDLLIVKSLLTGEANWIIFPEGRMVKNKKIFEDGQFMISSDEGKHRPHTGAATLALRSEFYRERIRKTISTWPEEAKRLMDLYGINSVEPVINRKTYIVPVNVTYYPVRVRENAISKLVDRFTDGVPERAEDELMTEGTMLLSGADIDIRFDEPIDIKEYLKDPVIQSDIESDIEINFDDKIPSNKTLRQCSYDLMQRYMTAIYKKVTVNHDHLLSAILTRYPEGKIDLDDFKAKSYFASTLNIKKDKYHLHESLEQNQINLLTDDKHEIFNNFIELALETGMIQESGGIYFKKNIDIEDFHTIRKENTISVLANEIEPLSNLLSHIDILANESKDLTQERLRSHILKSTIIKYENDYKNFYDKKLSKPMDRGEPYLIEGTSKEFGIVLVHGYLASPLEVKQLAEYLGEKGYYVYVPRLKGHGTSPKDLSGTNYQNWVDCVDEGYTIIRNLCKNVIAGGFSTGAGLVLDLAARVDDLKGVFAIAPPMELKDFSSKFVPAVDIWNSFLKKVHIDIAKVEFVDNEPENPHINYHKNPISGVHELEKLMDQLKPKLKEITVPVLIAQGRNDTVVSVDGTKKLFDLLGSEFKEYFLFNFNRHGVLVGNDVDRIYKAINDFVDLVFKGNF
ncbi:MAG: alpha/beta fold hydrolase [Desulfobacterales bacterium]|nr:alpha/beta fold hydrolase [Desulfobacterales bacterium]